MSRKRNAHFSTTNRDEISPCRVAPFFTRLSFVSTLSVRVFTRNEWNKGFAFGFVACNEQRYGALFNIFQSHRWNACAVTLRRSGETRKSKKAESLELAIVGSRRKRDPGKTDHFLRNWKTNKNGQQVGSERVTNV